MSRLIDWEQLRAEHEAVASQSDLSRRFGVTRGAIQKRIKKEGWAQDCEPVIQRKVAEKVAGLVAPCDPKKRADAIDAEADRRANVISRHRDEWDEHGAVMKEVFASRDFETAKFTKITAETLKIRQEAERKAWGLDPSELSTCTKDGSGAQLAIYFSQTQ